MKALLTFHSIDDSGTVISYPTRQFARLFESLARKNIPVYSLDTLLKTDTASGVAITFDDGMRSVYDNALPVIRDYDIPAHLFLTTKAIEDQRPWPEQGPARGFDMLDWEQLGILQESGFSIEAHTHTHPDMRKISRQEMEDECDTADRLIADKLGKQPSYFAYPFGFHNPAARDYVREHYQGAVTVELRSLGEREDPATIPRLDMYYFQSNRSIDLIDSPLMRFFLAGRSRLRAVRGSQCDPTCS